MHNTNNQYILYMKKAGRKVDISNININEIEVWMNNNKQSKNILKCQSIIALYKGAQMNEVCNVLGVTREAVRQWKEQLRSGGLTQLLKKGKVGKRSRLNALRLQELKKVIQQSPENYDFEEKKWTGNLVKQFAQRQWKIEISIRTAHQWLKKAK